MQVRNHWLLPDKLAAFFFFPQQDVLCLVTESCPTLCDPMDCSLPGSSVHRILQARILGWVAIPFNLSQHQGFIQWFGSSHQVLKYRSFSISPSSEYWGLISFRDWLLWSPCCPRDPQQSSPAPQFESINSSALSFLYSSTLISIYDHWKNHSLD